MRVSYTVSLCTIIHHMLLLQQLLWEMVVVCDSIVSCDDPVLVIAFMSEKSVVSWKWSHLRCGCAGVNMMIRIWICHSPNAYPLREGVQWDGIMQQWICCVQLLANHNGFQLHSVCLCRWAKIMTTTYRKLQPVCLISYKAQILENHALHDSSNDAPAHYSVYCPCCNAYRKLSTYSCSQERPRWVFNAANFVVKNANISTTECTRRASSYK